MRKAKYVQIADAFQRRVYNGDYAFSTIPGAKKLADEVGVSYLTARQAVQKLIDDGILRRQDNGRLEVCNHNNSMSSLPRIALIIPGGFQSVWVDTIRYVAQGKKCPLRTVNYSHNDDPVIFEALNGDFDIIFIHFANNSSVFLDKLCQHKDKVVTIFNDYTDMGLRCVDGPTPELIGRLMEYLVSLGHKNISYMNTQPIGPSSSERIQVWKKHIKKLKLSGILYNEPVQPFHSPTLKAHSIMCDILESNQMDSTALVCSSVDTATGVLRACYDNGVQVGADLSVCSFGEPDRAKMLIPSLTVVDRPIPYGEISAVIDQFIGTSSEPDRLMFRSEEKDILVGESTAIVHDIIYNK